MYMDADTGQSSTLRALEDMYTEVEWPGEALLPFFLTCTSPLTLL